MKDSQIWSTSVGRWCGVPVRIHLFLFLFVAVVFGAEWNVGLPNENFLFGTAMVTALVLLGSILVHEIAHVFAITSIGGRVDEMVLMPWGGNSESVIPDRGYVSIFAHVAGPFANAMVFLFGLTLMVQTDQSTFLQLINPFAPHVFVPAEWRLSIVEIVTWVNFQLMLVNLIPCFPFDGARILRSILKGSRIDVPDYKIELAIKLIGKAFASGLILFAFFYRHSEPGSIQPAWLFLLLSGVSLIFAAQYSMTMETEELNDDSWQDFDELDYATSLTESSIYLDSFDDGGNIAYSQWLSEKQESRRHEELLTEQKEDEMADVILEKLHSNGNDLGCLTFEERMILDRFSERIRRRRQQSV